MSGYAPAGDDAAAGGLPAEVVLAVDHLDRLDRTGGLPADAAASIRAIVEYVKAGGRW